MFWLILFRKKKRKERNIEKKEECIDFNVKELFENYEKLDQNTLYGIQFLPAYCTFNPHIAALVSFLARTTLYVLYFYVYYYFANKKINLESKDKCIDTFLPKLKRGAIYGDTDSLFIVPTQNEIVENLDEFKKLDRIKPRNIVFERHRFSFFLRKKTLLFLFREKPSHHT